MLFGQDGECRSRLRVSLTRRVFILLQPGVCLGRRSLYHLQLFQQVVQTFLQGLAPAFDLHKGARLTGTEGLQGVFGRLESGLRQQALVQVARGGNSSGHAVC
jgi:hypothetical protein